VFANQIIDQQFPEKRYRSLAIEHGVVNYGLPNCDALATTARTITYPISWRTCAASSQGEA